MERLIEAKMIYGGLMLVDQPHLVANYNKALTQFGFKPVAPPRFTIDAMGFSPEVAKLLRDEHYLDPHRVNPRFIILSPRQRELPYIQVAFSSTPELMRAFYDANGSALDSLTLKDVVFGEIEDDTWQVNRIEDLLSIRHVRIVLSSANGVLESAQKLEQLVTRFEREAGSWNNGALIDEMVGLAKITGDIRKSDPIPRKLDFTKNAFWADHFGGVYILRDEDGSHMVVGEPEAPPFPTKRKSLNWYLSLASPKFLFDYLEGSHRLESLNRDWLLGQGVLDQRMEQQLTAMMALSHGGDALGDLTPANTRKWAAANAQTVQTDRVYAFLTRIKKSLQVKEEIDLSRSAADLRFLVVRAVPDHADAGLINRLIAEYVPFDFVTRFMVNKPAFYRDYKTYPDNLRAYIVKLISDTYFVDKDQHWQKLFGPIHLTKKGPWG